jgi:hypothetical protein
MSRDAKPLLTFREALELLTLTPIRQQTHVELSDEEAFLIQIMLDDVWLWFDRVYGEQARRYRPPRSAEPDDPSDAPR